MDLASAIVLLLIVTDPLGNLPMVMVRVDAALRKKGLQEESRTSSEGFLDGSYTDPLRGLRNRRYLLERLQE